LKFGDIRTLTVAFAVGSLCVECSGCASSPVVAPTVRPTLKPTAAPSTQPTHAPTSPPSASPTPLPTSSPTPASATAYAFAGAPDGALPYASLVADAHGNFYGTTSAGGSAPCHCGTVFAATPGAGGFVEHVLHSFAGGGDGSTPLADLAIDASGTLYGTTYEGGTRCQCGTVFALTPHGTDYTEQVLYRFTGGADGSFPKGGVAFGADGALYGTTSAGASESAGTVFRLALVGSGYQETTVFAFGAGQGAHPQGDLLVRGNGLVGVTQWGGSTGYGTVYRLTPSSPSYSEQVLYNFVPGESGSLPVSGVVAGPHGTLFGATAQGGYVSTSNNGTGVVYELSTAGATYIEQAIVFAYNPVGVAVDDGGTVYFTTMHGGSGSEARGCNGGCGSLFALSRSFGKYRQTTLHTFKGGVDGATPLAGPILIDGRLYGTTSQGGYTSHRHCFGGSPPFGCGTIFAVKL
jgi:uncharacterized repeat protein (TIGR03803 family)